MAFYKPSYYLLNLNDVENFNSFLDANYISNNNFNLLKTNRNYCEENNKVKFKDNLNIINTPILSDGNNFNYSKLSNHNTLNESNMSYGTYNNELKSNNYTNNNRFISYKMNCKKEKSDIDDYKTTNFNAKLIDVNSVNDNSGNNNSNFKSVFSGNVKKLIFTSSSNFQNDDSVNNVVESKEFNPFSLNNSRLTNTEKISISNNLSSNDVKNNPSNINNNFKQYTKPFNMDKLLEIEDINVNNDSRSLDKSLNEDFISTPVKNK